VEKESWGSAHFLKLGNSRCQSLLHEVEKVPEGRMRFLT
jgi:hypothetical protein